MPPIKPRTVVRAGYSIFYNQSIYNSLAQKYLAYQPPFDQSQNLYTSAAQVLTLQNGFPAQTASRQDSEHGGSQPELPAGIRADLDAGHGNLLHAELAARSHLHRDERNRTRSVARAEPRAAGHQPARDANRAANSVCHQLLLRPVGRELHLQRAASPRGPPLYARRFVPRLLHLFEIARQCQFHWRHRRHRRAAGRQLRGRARPFVLRHAPPVPLLLHLRTCPSANATAGRITAGRKTRSAICGS